MRMSDEEYFRSCVAKERHLAHLLGHHEIEEFSDDAGTLWENTTALPKWTRDWSACGSLIATYNITIGFGKDPLHHNEDAVIAGSVTVPFSDHPTRERAIMYAIVKAVIHQLEHAKPCH